MFEFVITGYRSYFERRDLPSLVIMPRSLAIPGLAHFYDRATGWLPSAGMAPGGECRLATS
jgi:hypothetical protein